MHTVSSFQILLSEIHPNASHIIYGHSRFHTKKTLLLFHQQRSVYLYQNGICIFLFYPTPLPHLHCLSQKNLRADHILQNEPSYSHDISSNRCITFPAVTLSNLSSRQNIRSPLLAHPVMPHDSLPDLQNILLIRTLKRIAVMDHIRHPVFISVI